MTVIVEDGSQVANSNSYISLVDCNTYLTLLGLGTLTAATDEEYLLQAAQYVDTYRDKFKGYKTASTQSMQWPRYDVAIDGYSIDSDVIPNELKNAQCLAAYQLNAGKSLWNNNTTGQNVISKSVDVISITYADSGVVNSSPEFGQINAQLSPLLKSVGGLKAIRA